MDLLNLLGIHEMPSAAVAGAQGAPADGAPQQGGGMLPFLLGSNQYREAPFFTDVQLLGANSQDFIHLITPGNFLRGLTLQITSAGGVLGTTAALVQDSPFSILQSLTLEDISGGPLLYPMSGFAYAMIQKWFRPWDGDVTKRPDFSNTINPAFTIRLFVEVKETLAVLSNTDARAQYRIRYTVSQLALNKQFGLVSVATGVTAPTVTINGYVEMWAQPDDTDLLGNPIAKIPDGIVASRFNMHETPPLTAGNNIVRATLVGNECRAFAMIIRNGDAATTRVNLTDANAGAIDARLDNRRLWKMKQSQWIEEMAAFYDSLGLGTWTRDVGVYVYPRFHRYDQAGDYWLQTVEQTLLQFEFSGGDIANAPGTAEVLYDVLAIAGDVPAELEGM